MAAYTTIDNSPAFMSTRLYTGNGVAIGSGGNAITGVGFQPDMTWIKCRDATQGHQLFDSVRGATKVIWPEDAGAEATRTESLTTWGADGFTLGSDGDVNGNTDNYVSWNWVGGTTASGATTGSGTAKTYSYSANATSGYSTIKYTGNGSTGHTIPHGLGQAPEFIIIKDIANSNNWNCYHVTITDDYIFRLNTNAAKANENNRFNDTPTSTVFGLGDDAHTNGNDREYAAYAFAPKQGFSIFGNYIGNVRVPDGRFVYCGFRPAFIMIKNQDAAENWEMMDNKRQGFNAPSTSNKGNWRLIPNSSAIRNTNSGATFTSTGFKLIQSSSELNANNDNYSFAAFAEAPLASSEGIPANGR